MAEAKTDKGAKPAKGDKGDKPKGDKGAAPKAGKPDVAADAKGAKAKGRREAGGEVAAAGAVKSAPKDYVARLKKVYHDEIVPKLLQEFRSKCRRSTRSCSTWAWARPSTTPRRRPPPLRISR
jgi:hypothetical protein